MSDVELSALPTPLLWDVAPVAVSSDGVAALRIEAGPGTDLFLDPAGGAPSLNAPRLLTSLPDGDFQLVARVTVPFTSGFDAGVLLLWANERRWAKLCFECSPARQPMIVSVVTREVSDDANSVPVDSATAWLRISRLDTVFAFHASLDGVRWDFVRYFDLGASDVRVGFEAQSPTGQGCAVAFDDVSYRAERLPDLRDGR
ncbi:MAG TPA: DUF1349 domain-containing protein [Pseudonocardiaceae bacterium]|nr:DUF1349 domain-containing protein [Pseudonocardiaceae bacterium]